MVELACTPGQTVGPFFHLALPYSGDSRLVSDAHAGAIRLHGTVYDGAGDAVPDALVELWQTGPDGRMVRREGSLRRDGETFTGWGRCATDAAGRPTGAARPTISSSGVPTGTSITPGRTTAPLTVNSSGNDPAVRMV